jgi:hypothetical protein
MFNTWHVYEPAIIASPGRTEGQGHLASDAEGCVGVLHTAQQGWGLGGWLGGLGVGWVGEGGPQWQGMSQCRHFCGHMRAILRGDITTSDEQPSAR